MLTLQGVIFNLCTDTRDTAFFIHDSDDDDGTIDISIDVSFHTNTFEGDSVEPSISINPVKTNRKSLSELVGMSFKVKTVEEAEEREDTFYLWEHEPFESYVLTILDIAGDKIHIQCAGIAIIDGYAKPYKTADFSMDCWLPIITGKDDWAKYGL
ncbi:MAG: hypothetical protein K0Q73_8165 [Paenibacillus sp.]|jgi:hypothetical protein|nr:hypothetical protein [Paenibacillus sp.]